MSQRSERAHSGLPGSAPSHPAPSAPEAPRSEPPGPRRERAARRGLSYAVAGVAVAGFFLAIATGHRDSALLFVGLPGLLAVATALSPTRTTHGLTFKAITISLLLAAVYLHEGAICVLMAAPLVYGVGHGVVAIIRLADRSSRRGSYAVLGLLVVASMEGVIPGWRVAPEQAVTVVREVDLSPAAVAERVEAGPRLGPPRSLLLRTAGMPLPYEVSGDGLDVGRRWRFGYQGGSHSPGGETVTEVTARRKGYARFRVVRDTSITGRWLHWRSADLTWHANGDGGTRIVLTFRFVRGLDPSWYFGPIETGYAYEGAGYLLDGLVAPTGDTAGRPHH
ncbi:MAG: SRPBCC family protein [Micromonosporaceae bacterium]